MSYANGTTHYNLPQTVGTDKRDWFDTNQAFYDIDEALYGAVQQSTSTADALTTLTGRVTTNESDIVELQSNQTTDESAISALQRAVATNTSDIADVRSDAEDMICAYNEGDAQVSTHAYAIGDYFIYNDVLYKATSAIAVGDTIVPNTNCSATNVTSEIFSEASSVLKEMYSGYPVRLIGIRLDDLTNENYYQTSLFDNIDNRENDSKVDRVIDDINKKYGYNTIKILLN